MEEEGERRAYKGTVGGGLESVGERAGHGVDAGVEVAVENNSVISVQSFEHYIQAEVFQ